MKKLVLLRHGLSQWNNENRFTGWVDVPLSDAGIEEAKNAGKLLKEAGFEFDVAYTSVLKRAIQDAVARAGRAGHDVAAGCTAAGA